MSDGVDGAVAVAVERERESSYDRKLTSGELNYTPLLIYSTIDPGKNRQMKLLKLFVWRWWSLRWWKRRRNIIGGLGW